jgi:hypothetical protein
LDPARQIELEAFQGFHGSVQAELSKTGSKMVLDMLDLDYTIGIYQGGWQEGPVYRLLIISLFSQALYLIFKY